MQWLYNMPFFAVRLIPRAALFAGVTPFGIALCIGLYLARMFVITAG